MYMQEIISNVSVTNEVGLLKLCSWILMMLLFIVKESLKYIQEVINVCKAHCFT